MEHSVSHYVSYHLGRHSTVYWPLRGGRSIKYTKTLKRLREKRKNAMIGKEESYVRGRENDIITTAEGYVKARKNTMSEGGKP